MKSLAQSARLFMAAVLIMAVLVVLVVLVVLAACGTPSPDLFVVERTGTIPGAKLTLRVQDGGEVFCDGRDAGMMASGELIRAREDLRELEGGAVDRQNDVTSSNGPLDRNLRLPPGPDSILRYTLRAQEGTVAFSDSSPRQPKVFFKLASLVRDLAKGVCGLPR